MPSQLWIVESSEESANMNWETVKRIARQHNGYYCTAIGGHNTAWRTLPGFAFRTEADAVAFEHAIKQHG